jgi:hypothetical protein
VHCDEPPELSPVYWRHRDVRNLLGVQTLDSGGDFDVDEDAGDKDLMASKVPTSQSIIIIPSTRNQLPKKNSPLYLTSVLLIDHLNIS